MAWVLFGVPTTKRGELDAVLADDVVSRQSRKIREAQVLGGPAGELFVMIEGSAAAVQRAEELLSNVGRKLPPGEAAALERKLREEDEAASSGMGLFFTE